MLLAINWNRVLGSVPRESRLPRTCSACKIRYIGVTWVRLEMSESELPAGPHSAAFWALHCCVVCPAVNYMGD